MNSNEEMGRALHPPPPRLFFILGKSNTHWILTLFVLASSLVWNCFLVRDEVNVCFCTNIIVAIGTCLVKPLQRVFMKESKLEHVLLSSTLPRIYKVGCTERKLATNQYALPSMNTKSMSNINELNTNSYMDHHNFYELKGNVPFKGLDCDKAKDVEVYVMQPLAIILHHKWHDDVMPHHVWAWCPEDVTVVRIFFCHMMLFL